MAKPTRIRFLVLAWVGTGAACAYLTRVALAAANTTIQSELELTDLQMGDVLAAFFVGYLIFQIPGGWLGVRFGRRATLAGLAACGSVATVWTAMADGMPGLRYSRIILGLAQAGMVPCTASVLKDWWRRPA